MRRRTALPVSPPEASSQRSAVMPDLAASRLSGVIRTQVAEVNQLRSSLARLDEALARLSDLDGPEGGFTAGWKLQQLQTERDEVVQKLTVVEPRLTDARERLMVLADPSLTGATVLPSGHELLAQMQQRAQHLQDFISTSQTNLDDGVEKELKNRIRSSEDWIARATLPATRPGAAGKASRANLETENARLHRELHALRQTQADLASAREELHSLQQRLPVAVLCAQGEHLIAAPQAQREESGTSPQRFSVSDLDTPDDHAPLAPRPHRHTLGELIAQERQEQEAERAQLVHAALPNGGAVMKRLTERASREHPATRAEKLRARLNGPPKPMEGRRKEAFEALVRTDVMALSKTGKMEPRLAALEMHKAVLDETQGKGKGILAQDRQLLLDVLGNIAKGGVRVPTTGTSPPLDAHATSSLSPVDGPAPTFQAPNGHAGQTLTPSTEFGWMGDVPQVVGVVDKSNGEWPREWYAEPYVRGKDGVVRRFPVSHGGSMNYVDQVFQGVIYDSPGERVTQRIAGFEVSKDNKHSIFTVHGNAVSPIKLGSFEAYPLPNGKFMVPQPGFRDCTFACELMLLLDHGKIDLSNGDAFLFSHTNFRREMEDIAMSLESKTGIQPIVVKHDLSYKPNASGQQDHGENMHAWRDLGNKIKEFGPCILSTKGHVVMLDNVREEEGTFFLTIREPFHGTSVELREHEEFFQGLHVKRLDFSLSAIFLSSNQDACA